MAHAGELARGNFRARLPQTDSSEFGQLAQTLNETAENLQQTVAQLQHEHAELEKLERIRKDFVINVSHELRTPLASIQGYTETLIDGALADPDHNMRFLGIIRHNAERLARLTEDLLTLSRVEQKRQKFEFDIHPANSLIHDAFELVGPIARKSYIELVEERAPEDAVVCCDSEAVSQILSNLLDNAIKYTPAGGKITVGASPVGSDGRILCPRHRRGNSGGGSCRACSNASIAWIRRARANSAAPAWDFPSSNTWLRRTTALPGWRAPCIKDPRSFSHCRWMKPHSASETLNPEFTAS